MKPSPKSLNAVIAEGRQLTSPFYDAFQSAVTALHAPPGGWPEGLLPERTACEIRAESADVASLILYGDIGGGGLFADGVSAADFLAELRAVTARKIRVHINSKGGDVFAGLAIYNTLRTHPAKVETVVEGVAASIASVIALAGRKVTMHPASLLMIHEPWALALGGADEMRAMAALLDKTGEMLAGVYVAKTGAALEQVREWMKSETWFTAAEAESAAFIDKIAEGRPEPATPAAPDPLPEPEPAVAAAHRREAMALSLSYLTGSYPRKVA